MSNVDRNLQSYLWQFVMMDKIRLCKTVLKGHTSKPRKLLSFIFNSTTRQTYAEKVSLFFFTVKLILITSKNKNNSMFLHVLYTFEYIIDISVTSNLRLNLCCFEATLRICSKNLEYYFVDLTQHLTQVYVNLLHSQI